MPISLLVKYLFSCRILIKLEFSRQIFETLKYLVSRKTFQWEPSRFMRSDGGIDRYEKVNSRFLQFNKLA